MFQESIRSTQWEIQHQKQHVKQHVKHWFFATVVAGAGKGNFQLPDTAAVSSFSDLNFNQAVIYKISNFNKTAPNFTYSQKS